MSTGLDLHPAAHTFSRPDPLPGVQLVRLSSLSARSNNLAALPASLGGLSSLTYLDASMNQLKVAPGGGAARGRGEASEAGGGEGGGGGRGRCCAGARDG